MTVSASDSNHPSTTSLVRGVPFTHRMRAALIALPDWVYLAVVVLVHVACVVVVLERGFLEYNADGYARIIRGHEWLQSPRWEVSVWLPLQTWLFGVGLFVHDSLSVTPRTISFALSVVTLVSLFLIGRAISGRAAGLIAATLGAVFPWTVWFSVSGLSEALFHATLTLGVVGFVRWLADPRDRWLGLAAVGLSFSTMVRYEGWFYATVFLALVVGFAWQRRRVRLSTIALGLVPMLFPLLWIEQYWQLHDDPFGFARETAEIKASLDAGNATASVWQRLTVYPEETLRLAPWLGLLCGLATIYALVRRVTWWPLIALICGQGLLLIGVSAGFSNLGPGAERYLLSNFILLFPVLGASVMLLPCSLFRAAGLGATALISLTLIRTLIAPPTWYPDATVRDVARIADDELSSIRGRHDLVPVLLPDPPAEGFNAIYALRILSNHPDAWIITSDPAVFVAIMDTTAPPLWLIDTDSGFAPPEGWQIERVGRYLVGTPSE